MRGSSYSLLVIFGLLTALLVAGTLGFRIVEGVPWFDAFYMALITLTTVGYEETIVLSPQGRVFNTFLMLGGVTSLFVSVGILADFVIKLELANYFGRRRRSRMLGRLRDHYIVCGGGRVGRGVVEEFLKHDAPVVIVDYNKSRLQWAIERDIPTIVADATHDETLRDARIGSARGLVAAIGSDAANVYIILAARSLNPGLRISSRSSDEEAEEKLRIAGASTVLTPYRFIGHWLAQAMLRPEVLSFLDVASAFSKSSAELEVGQATLGPSTDIAGKTLAETQIRTRYSVIVLGIQKGTDVRMRFNPSGDTRIEIGDTLVALGDVADLKRMEIDVEK